MNDEQPIENKNTNQDTVQLKAYSKWNSRRWRITVWAMTSITILLGYSIITKTNPEWFGLVLPILLAIPNLYIGAESFTKVKLNKGDNQ